MDRISWIRKKASHLRARRFPAVHLIEIMASIAVVAVRRAALPRAAGARQAETLACAGNITNGLAARNMRRSRPAPARHRALGPRGRLSTPVMPVDARRPSAPYGIARRR